MSNPKQYDEQALLKRLCKGDHEAFHTLYDHHKWWVASKLLFLLKSEVLVQDAMQNIFIRIWEKRAWINPTLPFSAFLHTLVRNEVSNLFRQANQNRVLQQQLMQQPPVVYLPVDDMIRQRENTELLNQALQQLPDRQREVFVLHKIEGKSYREISEKLGITAAAINQHIYRASKRLNELLNPKIWGIIAVTSEILRQLKS